MKNGKSPGSDGLTVEFYRTFWELPSQDLLNALKIALQQKSLGETQNQAIITCIYKSGDRNSLENWRPISLLNTDYKILTKTIANKMNSSLKDIISPNQSASVPGRSILTNISSVRDIIQYADDKKLPAALISIDQSKAFDRVNWDFLFKTLTKFGYGHKFINIIKTLYKDIKSQVKINGFLTPSIILERGVRQGCPLSMILYAITGEVFANYINSKTDIKGIKIGETELKITQHADDTNFFVAGINSILKLGIEIDKFEKATGAKLNIGKCQGMWLGSYKAREDKPLNYKWTEIQIKVLGVYLANPGVPTEITENENWNKYLKNINDIINIWKQPKLSLKGKRIIINQLILSKIWFLAQVIPVPQKVITDLEGLVLDFLWGGRQTRVRKQVLYLPIKQGGLGLIDITTKIQSLHLRWVGKLLDNTLKGPWKILMIYQLNKLRKATQGASVFRTFVEQPAGVPKFYINLLKSWKTFTNNQRDKPNTLEQILNEPIFYNRFINNECKYLKPTKWSKDKITIIADVCLVHAPGFLSMEQIQDITQHQITQQQYNKIIMSIPDDWRALIMRETQLTPHQYESLTVTRNNKIVPIEQITSRQFYELLIIKKDFKKYLKIHRWAEQYSDQNILKPNITQWSNIFKNLINRNHNTLAFDIRWKLLHFAHPSMYRLGKMKVVDSAICQRCNNKVESNEHWFVFCENNQTTITFLLQFMDLMYPDAAPFNADLDLFLFGFAAKGYKGNMDLGEDLLDDYFCAVYQNRMNKLNENKNGNLLQEFKSKMEATIKWRELKEELKELEN